MIDILYVLKVPPPVHGSTIMNQIVAESKRIGDNRNQVKHLQSISKDVGDIGKFSFRKIILIIRNYIRLLYDLIKHNPKLIYFSITPKGKAFYKDLVGIIFIKILKKRIVYHFHVKGLTGEAKKSSLKKLFYNYAFNNEYAIVLSELLKKEFEDFGFQKIFTVPNGIEESNIKVSNQKGDDYFTIIYLSNFIREKGVLEFIEAMRVLKEKGFYFRLNIIGKSSDVSLENIEALLHEYGLYIRVNHIGAAYGDEKNKLLSNSSLFIFPTYYKNECYPLVLLEAMQFGLPIITSDEGAISDIVKDGENGFIINPKSPNEIAEKASILLVDNDIYKKMSNSSRSFFINNNTVNKFENNLNFVLKDILSFKK